MSDTSCEICGMRWNARPRELCPRCNLADADDALRIERARVRTLEEALRVIADRCADGAVTLEQIEQAARRALSGDAQGGEGR